MEYLFSFVMEVRRTRCHEIELVKDSPDEIYECIHSNIELHREGTHPLSIDAVVAA